VQRTAEDAVAGALDLAAQISALAPLSAHAHKAAMNRVSRAGMLTPEDLEVLEELETRAFLSADFQEGLAAFSEKRSPRFSGQ